MAAAAKVLVRGSFDADDFADAGDGDDVHDDTRKMSELPILLCIDDEVCRDRRRAQRENECAALAQGEDAGDASHGELAVDLTASRARVRLDRAHERTVLDSPR